MKKIILSIAMGLVGMTTYAQITLNGCGDDTLCFGSSKQISFTGDIGSQNKYFYTNNTPSSSANDMLEANLLPNASGVSTFTYDFWVKPEKTISLTNVNNRCTRNWDLFYGSCNWALMASHGGSSKYGVGVSVGTNGICVGEHQTNILTSRITYSGSINGWNHVALVVRTDSMFLYLNGNMVNSRAVDVCPSVPRMITNAFAQKYAQSGNFMGGLDEIRIWGVGLSSSQINYIMDKKFMDSVNNLLYYTSFDNGYFKTSGNQGTYTINTFGYDTTNILNGGVNLTNVSGTSINSLTPITTTYYYGLTPVISPFYVPIDNVVNNIQIYGISGTDTTYSNLLTYYGKDCHTYDTIRVYDTTYVQVVDSIAFYHDQLVMIYDTTYVNIYDTTYVNIYDTIIFRQNVTDTIQVTDTLLINWRTIGIYNSTIIDVFKDIKVYPVPTQHKLTIDLGDMAQFAYYYASIVQLDYFIYNDYGGLVLSGQLTQNKTEIEVSNLSSGNYKLVLDDHIYNAATTKNIVIIR